MSARQRSRRLDQNGQVLVIFAGGLIVLFGIAALVVDLGFTFITRRAEQNVADPAAIAAARFIRSTGGTYADMKNAACFVAHQNGLFGGPSSGALCDNPANDPDGTILQVNFPPSAAGGTFQGRAGFVEVVVTRNHRTLLGGVIGLRNIRVSASAVAAFSNGDSNTNSLMVLNPTGDCSTLKTHGSGNINIHAAVPGSVGGYVQVNSTCSNGAPNTTCSSGGGSGALDIAGGGILTSPHIYVTGTCKSNSTPGGPLTEGAVQVGDPLGELAPPDPADYPAGRCGPTLPPLTPGAGGCVFKDAGVTHLEPGVYYGGWDVQKNGAVIELGTGVYVLAGGGLKLSNGGTITSVDGGSGVPAPVLIFNTDDPSTHLGQADINMNARATLKLSAIDTGPYKGIVIWNDGAGSNPGALIDLEGQTSLILSGTVYSPKGFVKLDGGNGAGSTASIQIISWTMDVGGNSTLDMPYDPSELYQFNEKGLVH
jgi:hypothetical protein